jgi:glycosyltransferase involved in cell wall biosynthesis
LTITILLPVYGRSPWLKQALTSIQNQTSGDWNLVIADDGSDEAAQLCIQHWLYKQNSNQIGWNKRPKNLGLFKNLNQAINETSTEWVILLCSDDIFHDSAIADIANLRSSWPEASLILSTFDSINCDGTARPPDSSSHHDELQTNTGLIEPEQMLPALLRLGSLNGNLTGMAFSRSLWRSTGGFREDWRHAADWDWLIRASEQKALLLNRKPIASVRTHEGQLSVKNRVSGHEVTEVAAVIERLLAHEMLLEEPQRWAWAGHVMQFQLWNLLKAAGQGDWSHWSTGLQAIHKSAGLRQTCMSLLGWLPSRWKTRASRSSR